jgi:gamma-tubulin complex component 3
LRDLLYVFQGIDGRFLKYEARSDAFVLDASVKLPRPTMELVNKLAELGWLYFTIQKNLGGNSATTATTATLVGQSLHSAFKDELVDFYRLIAMLENELFSIENRPDSFTAIGLSLKRLFVWVLEPLERLRLIHLLMDGTKEAKGGAIVSCLYKYAEHGDPYIKAFVSKLLPKVRALNLMTNVNSLRYRSHAPSLICSLHGLDMVNCKIHSMNSASWRTQIILTSGAPSMPSEWTWFPPFSPRLWFKR